MQKKILDVLDEIFGEVAEQYYFQKSINLLNDIRLTSYVNFANTIFNLLQDWNEQTVQNLEELLDKLHFELWESMLFEKMEAHEIFDNKWLLMHIEYQLLGQNTVYEKHWEDLSTFQRQYESIYIHLAKNSMYKGSIWEIKGKKYAVGGSFALCSDIWLKSLEDSDRLLHQSYRLADLLPLDEGSYKIFWVGLYIPPD